MASVAHGGSIVAAIELHLPGPVIAIIAVAVAGVAVGIWVISRLVRRENARETTPREA